MIVDDGQCTTMSKSENWPLGAFGGCTTFTTFSARFRHVTLQRGERTDVNTTPKSGSVIAKAASLLEVQSSHRAEKQLKQLFPSRL